MLGHPKTAPSAPTGRKRVSRGAIQEDSRQHANRSDRIQDLQQGRPSDLVTNSSPVQNTLAANLPHPESVETAHD